MSEIKEYEEKYAEEISNIVTRNLLEINIKDYGLEFSKKHAEEFTVDKIKENFKTRTKTYVALKNNNQPSLCYSNYDITIKKELRTIFEGTEDEDMVTTKGRNSDLFESHIKCGHEKCV